jgi:hypothetical protein
MIRFTLFLLLVLVVFVLRAQTLQSHQFQHKIVSRGETKQFGEFITVRIAEPKRSKTNNEDKDIVEIWQQMWTFLLAMYSSASNVSMEDESHMSRANNKNGRTELDLHADKRWLPSQARQRCTDKGTVHMTVFLSLDSLCIVHRTDLYSVQRTLELLPRSRSRLFNVDDVPRELIDDLESMLSPRSMPIPYVAVICSASLTTFGTAFSDDFIVQSTNDCVSQSVRQERFDVHAAVSARHAVDVPVVSISRRYRHSFFHRIIEDDVRLFSAPELLSSDRVRFQFAHFHAPLIRSARSWAQRAPISC